MLNVLDGSDGIWNQSSTNDDRLDDRLHFPVLLAISDTTINATWP